MDVLRQPIMGMQLVKSELLASCLLHIPHSSTYIPNLNGFNVVELEKNIEILTDWATDMIFNVDGIEKLISPFSRLYCDVERLQDDDEPMFKIGRGYYYTHGFDGKVLRELVESDKLKIYRDYYLEHHLKLKREVDKRLSIFGSCIIFDCHSFNDPPVGSILEHPLSPDICIGTDTYHSPNYLIEYTVNYFKNLGYSIELNNPYCGCIIPMEYYLRKANVKGIMIEINKRLYMNKNKLLSSEVNKLRSIMIDYFENM
ncbi:MAG: N-formylglutamate amidohydrolase [Saprospiraceae bacterium]|nr:N-formylglutamate amidohydrolase [Saprospiraceae bacterium]